MAETESKQTNNVITALCAAALVPSLRSILVFDAHPAELRRIARTAAEILRVVDKRPITTLTLGSSETDDDLWGNYMLQAHSYNSPLFWQPGLLFDGPDKISTRVMLIP